MKIFKWHALSCSPAKAGHGNAVDDAVLRAARREHAVKNGLLALRQVSECLGLHILRLFVVFFHPPGVILYLVVLRILMLFIVFFRPPEVIVI